MDITEIKLNMATTVAIAAVLIVIGNFFKKRVPVLERFFIPNPVIGGFIFSLVSLVGYKLNLFRFVFYTDMQGFLLLVFFTTIGFMASFELLKKGGMAVMIFLGIALVMLITQNMVGTFLASALGINPLIGLAAGSVSLTGGHGTAAAFGPLLEEAGATGATAAAVASATWGLVFGCLIGGPVALRLLKRHKLDSTMVDTSSIPTHKDIKTVPETQVTTTETSLHAVVLIALCIGLGYVLTDPVNWGLKYFSEFLSKVLTIKINIALPAYLLPMLVAVAVRNMIDAKNWTLPLAQFDIVGNISLMFFLTMALMSMKLWELAAIAGPLVIILIIQTILIALFAYFVTFRIMGKNYDAAVMSAGQCGFGLGATPNAMANMQSFTQVNGPSLKAFFVVPLVGSLFIDPFNAIIISIFIGLFGNA
ncbi:MAG: sodium/glutamate symporter [Neisseriaceae bacterium]|nr:sodium/glutamate symporter [Neisseriaceae bacterium]